MIAFALVLIGMTGAHADFPEDDIEVIIPYAAGGGFDSYVRGVLPYMQKYLPNDVNLIPRNMPGAGGRPRGCGCLKVMTTTVVRAGSTRPFSA